MLYALGGYFIRFLRILYRMLTLRLKQIRSSRASIHATYGKNTRIGSGSVVTDDVIIGNYTYINTGSTAEYCTIGSYCSISSGVRINPWEHNLSAMSTSPSLGGSNKDLRKRVFIDDDCLIRKPPGPGLSHCCRSSGNTRCKALRDCGRSSR